MPVFLLPIVAGGYYYYQTMKEKVRGEPLQEIPPEGDESPDLASSSIEVSLVMTSQRQNDAAEQPLRTISEEGSIKSQVLHRKESTDTAQTETSEDDSTSNRGILGTVCGDCDQEGLFEFVECGGHGSNSLERGIAVVFSR